jgi:imidazolonepropionase-like amidohydrolase/ABC-type multidrug transport system permease subunit
VLETWRSKPALFWNLVLPLLFVVGLGYVFGGGEPQRVRWILPGILTINLLTMSFFGVSLHMVSLREREVYRRFRVTPLESSSVVLAHAATAFVNILVSTILQLLVARFVFHLDVAGSAGRLALAVPLAAFALVPLGLITGSVAEDMKTAPLISNLVYFPMLFLSGASMPLFLMPEWLQRVARLLPATYSVELLRGAILGGEEFGRLAVPAAILFLTGVVALAFNSWLFRWECRDPINLRALVAAIALLTLIYGAAFATKVRLGSAVPPAEPEEPTAKVESGPRVLTGMTILDGLGGRIERGRVIIERGRIVSVGPAEGSAPTGVPIIDLSGLYMIPGLIDSHVHIGGSPGGSVSSIEYIPARVIHDLQAYLGLGVTSFVSLTDFAPDLERLRRAVAAGTMRAPRPYFSGPGITAPGGHPAKAFRVVAGLAESLTREVDSPQAAEAAVREIASMRVDLIKLFLEAGWPDKPTPVLPEAELRAAIRVARVLHLPTTVHVDNDRHARLAIEAGALALEHVPLDLSDETIAIMVRKGVTMTPTLAAYEGLTIVMKGDPFTDPLVRTWVDPNVLASLYAPESRLTEMRKSLAEVDFAIRRYAEARRATRRAVAAGVTILAGSDSGNPGTFHGPALIRELELLVEQGGMSPTAALVAASGAAARRLGSTEIGRIAPGAFADFVVLERDPARDIRAVRQVLAVYFRGVPIRRETLLSSSPGGWMPRFGVQAQ